MRPLDSILRVLVALLIGLVPMLCCCGTAEAGEADVQAVAAMPAEDAAAHACCASEDRSTESDRDAPVAPAHEKPGDHDCGCNAHLSAMKAAPAEAVVAPAVAAELPCLHLAPLPRALAALLPADPVGAAGEPSTLDAAALPPAPTLRTLGVLLLT